jgi:DinB superfamily
MTHGNAALIVEFDAAIDLLKGAIRDCPLGLWEASLWKVERREPGVWPKNDRPESGRTDSTVQVFSALWKVAYHTLFYLDWYMTTELMETPITPDGSFEPPAFIRGGVEERPFDDDWTLRLPDHVYQRELLLRYLHYGRRRAHQVISALTEDDLAAKCPRHHPHEGKTLAELLQINLAHLREHAAQITQFLAERQHA